MKSVIFDMDDVLIHSFEKHWKAFDFVMKKRFGFNVGRKEFLDLFGSDPRDITRKLFENHGITNRQDINEIYSEKKKVYEDYCKNGVEVLPGVTELLESLKQAGIPFAVASSSSSETVKSMMEKSGLGTYFKVRVGLDDVARGKPHTDLFLKAAKEIGVSPKDCWVVEDSLPGVQAGKNAGMKVLGVMTGQRTQKELEENGADLVVENLSKVKLEDLIA